MGQKEIFILIVGVIIAGIGILFSISLFTDASMSANNYAVRQDLASIASSAQAYYKKPRMLGGGGKSFQNIDFYHIVFNQVSFPYDSIFDNGINAVNENGFYRIVRRDTQSVRILGIPAYSSYVPGDSLTNYIRIRAFIKSDKVIQTILDAK